MEGMRGVVGNQAIEFTQGDTYTYMVELADESLVGFLERVVFSCKFYGIERDFEKSVNDSGGVVFSVRFEETNQMKPAITNYDVTMFFNDGVREHIVSETGIRFVVREKKNPLSEV